MFGVVMDEQTPPQPISSPADLVARQNEGEINPFFDYTVCHHVEGVRGQRSLYTADHALVPRHSRCSSSVNIYFCGLSHWFASFSHGSIYSFSC